MQSLAEGANALQILFSPLSFMATHPRWLAAVLEGPEGADGAGNVPADSADTSALGPPSAEAIVEVPVVELVLRRLSDDA